MRRGAWDAKEDVLLRTCIQKYGEGKWHLVPHRAGLNRCRKSCRLRWLNHLKPNIKKGDFETDEVELMIRLHKLLGNRWSLIAGRLPGRTANNVKNYWNTRGKKLAEPPPPPQDLKTAAGSTGVLKPRPRTISKKSPPCLAQEKIVSPSNDQNIQNNNNITSSSNIIGSKSLPQTPPEDDGTVQWWIKLLGDSTGSDNEVPSTDFRTNHEIISKAVNNSVEEGKNGWSDIWDLLNSDQVV